MTRPRYDLELLLDVAIEEFTKRGYDGTSIEHLSTATGLSKSSLYHHVEGKEHILRLGLERAVTPQQKRTHAASQAQGAVTLSYAIIRKP